MKVWRPKENVVGVGLRIRSCAGTKNIMFKSASALI